MKKKIMTAIAVMAFGLIHAQDIKFGTKVGLNISTLTGDINYTKNKTGFHFGGFAEIKLTDDFSLQPEILYSTQGTKSIQYYSDISGGIKIDLTQNLTYINVPIIAKLYILEKFYIEAGPQIGFLLNAEQKGEANGYRFGNPYTQSITVDNKDTLNTTDFGLNFGAGINLTDSIGAGVRYTLGVSNIDKETNNSGIYNSNLGISLLLKL